MILLISEIERQRCYYNRSALRTEFNVVLKKVPGTFRKKRRQVRCKKSGLTTFDAPHEKITWLLLEVV